jgi:hypothetical protein
VLAGGCTGGSDCLAVALPGIVVFVVDNISGTPAAAGARGAVQAGTFRDSLIPHSIRGTPPNDTLLSLQSSRAGHGTYLVTIEQSGYLPWQQAGVRVTQGGCGLHTTTLTARLLPDA